MISTIGGGTQKIFDRQVTETSNSGSEKTEKKQNQAVKRSGTFRRLT